MFNRTSISLFRLVWKNSKTKFSTQSLFPSARTTWTEQLEFTGKHSYEPIPVYRVLDRLGDVIKPEDDPNLPSDVLIKMYKDMTILGIMDKVLYEAQRQGRISFYMTNTGEEASHVGSAAALDPSDVVYSQYREAGVLLWRGFALQQFIDQCYGNRDDNERGKNMPVHYGCDALNFISISSPLGTQLPQAVGSAYALKGKNRIVVCYFGDGAASEGDAHAALNFASTLNCPIIFFCRNNGYAISTPVSEQYGGDGIAARGPGYGINTIRVDGNDALAVYNATKKSRDYALSENKPVLIEAMTYRIGDHSTSDDSTAYRSKEEIRQWSTNDDPVAKLRYYITSKGIWNDEKNKEWLEEAKKEFMVAFKAGEKKHKPHWEILFEDVYKFTPEHLEKQMAYMKQHVEKFKNHYPVNEFDGK
ncbi:unnamed protein product [Phyllotreta striolata]|uniref:2-oxoisovalerate dehydrogenase subunit alpha n=1 Tax=Phyllotreta striolata TaxID=444603 RepID=A0A9N9XSU1_PHYSR|nr:unnamed protein product [Phyllotreta striolata]